MVSCTLSPRNMRAQTACGGLVSFGQRCALRKRNPKVISTVREGSLEDTLSIAFLVRWCSAGIVEIYAWAKNEGKGRAVVS